MIDECCLFHVPYEILDKTPTENEWDYPVPFVRINKKEKKAWILVNNKDAKGTWIPFGGSQNAIEKIITACGEIIPQDGLIELIEGDGITFNCENNKLTIGIKIPLTTGQGGTGITEYTLGDLLIGNEDGTLSKLPKGENGQVLGIKSDGSIGYIDTIQKCPTETEITENAFPRWDDQGKCLKNSKTIQDDEGNITTTGSVFLTDVGFKDLFQNKATGLDAHATREVSTVDGGGHAIFRAKIETKQAWDWRCDRSDYSYIVRGTPEPNPGQAKDYLKINTEGNTTTPKNYSVTAQYVGRSPNFPDNTSLALGSERVLTILEQTGNNFFPGGGGNPAVYTFNEPHTVLAEMTFVVGKGGEATLGFLEATAQIEQRGSKNQFYFSMEQLPNVPSIGRKTLHLSKIIKGETGDQILFYLSGRGKDWYIENTLDPKITSFIDIYCVG